MIRYLTNLLDVATERRFRAFLLGVGAAAVVTMFATASLGFGAFAAYGYLRPVEGPVAAALILCAASGALALAIGAFTWTRHRHAKCKPMPPRRRQRGMSIHSSRVSSRQARRISNRRSTRRCGSRAT